MSAPPACRSCCEPRTVRGPKYNSLVRIQKPRLNNFMKPITPRRAGPPHNANVRELVAAKRKWASSLTQEQARAGFKGWHERGYLPHRDEPGLTQMVTFHVDDAFPTALR